MKTKNAMFNYSTALFFVALFTALTSDTCLCQNASAEPKATMTDLDLKLAGGWRLPSAGAGGRGLGFTRGGLYVEHGKGENRLLYICGFDKARVEAHVLRVSLAERGSDPGERTSWPMAHPTKLLMKANEEDARAICRPNLGGPLLTSGRIFYAVDPKQLRGPWMSWYNDNTGALSPLAVPRAVDQRQAYGEGFCDIPKWFADAHLNGRDFGVGHGGYESGQGSATGPTLFVSKRPADWAPVLKDCTPLLYFPWNAPKQQREHRPADYSTPLWGPAAENDEGWWQADLVTAGPVWIDTPELTGLCYWAEQGLGDLNYKLQRDTFSKQVRTRLYVYSAKDLASVAKGRRKPWEIHGKVYEWKNPFDETPNASRWPIGAYWDSTDQLLYVAYRNSAGGNYEIAPVVCVYTVNATNK